MNIVHTARLDIQDVDITNKSATYTSANVFEQIVKDDTDVASLLAYALYELSIQDWRKNFLIQFSREPGEDEKNIFMVGEVTPRRLAAYKSQAESILIQYKTGELEYTLNPLMSKPFNASKPSSILSTLNDKRNLVNSSESPWVKGTKAALRLPPDTNLKNLGKSILILFVLVGLLAIAVNYAKVRFF